MLPNIAARLAAALLLAACCTFVSAQTSVCVAGKVAQPACYTGAQLAALPAQTADFSFATGKGPQQQHWTGPLVWDLLAKPAALDSVIVAIGQDGYPAVFSAGELDPRAGAMPSIVALLPSAQRMTAPGDVKGGRYVFSLARLEVRGAGEGELVRRLDAAEIRAAGPGALWAVLTAAGAAPAEAAGGLRSWIVAQGANGQRVVLAAAEIDPAFGARRASITARQDGSLQLAVPSDKSAVRTVEGLRSLEIMKLPAKEKAP